MRHDDTVIVTFPREVLLRMRKAAKGASVTEFIRRCVTMALRTPTECICGELHDDAADLPGRVIAREGLEVPQRLCTVCGRWFDEAAP